MTLSLKSNTKIDQPFADIVNKPRLNTYDPVLLFSTIWLIIDQLFAADSYGL
jgi:hypothetical protein